MSVTVQAGPLPADAVDRLVAHIASELAFWKQHRSSVGLSSIADGRIAALTDLQRRIQRERA